MINDDWGRVESYTAPSNVAPANVAISADGTQYMLTPNANYHRHAAIHRVAAVDRTTAVGVSDPAGAALQLLSRRNNESGSDCYFIAK